jgi:predicted metal-dependent hydrolase
MLQLSLNFLQRQLDRLAPSEPPRRGDGPLAWKHGLTVHIIRRPKARRYLLGLQADGSARLVIPRRGTEADALRFLERSEAWLLRRLAKWRDKAKDRQPWQHGVRFLYRGEEVAFSVEAEDEGVVLRFAEQVISLPQALPDYRATVYARLRRIAERELKARTHELAKQHGVTISRVTVRAQRSRWGSCSRSGTISLNWRLVQTPPFVVDYLIVHELMHRREMNHSKRYWKHVADAFPAYCEAEAWLKKSKIDLREDCPERAT